MAERYAEYFPPFIKRACKAELLDEKLLQFDLARLGAALDADRDLQFDYLGLQTLYDRYFLHIDERAHRAAAGVLHARRDGPGAERDRPRSARDRVLQRAVELRLHVLDADAVQLRHAPLAAVELLPDDGRRRPRRHLRSAEGKRAAVEVRRRPRQRLDARARARLAHQGHQRQEPGRRAVPEGRQRHGGRRQPGRQAQGRGLRVPGDAGTSTSRSSSSCARTPATTAAARTT